MATHLEGKNWDCLDDLEAAGLLESKGTGLYPVYKLTKAGIKVASALRAHKGNGGSFGDFDYEKSTMER